MNRVVPLPWPLQSGSQAAPDPVEEMQHALLLSVFAAGMRPQAALAEAIRAQPDIPLLKWVFVATSIGADLRPSFKPDENWSHSDWFEAAASLGCDAYALVELGRATPTGHDLAEIWAEDDPHLR